jgi:hypothetical protein
MLVYQDSLFAQESLIVEMLLGEIRDAVAETVYVDD